MDERDLINFAREAFNREITREDFKDPLTPEFVKDIYQLFLFSIGFNLAQPDLQAIQGIDNIERFDDAIVLINTVKIMQMILTRRGFKGPKFTIMDLTRPDRKRTITILGHLVQVYIRYHEAREAAARKLAEREPLMARVAARQEESEQLRSKLVSLSRSVAAKKALEEEKLEALARETKKLQLIREKCKNLEETYAAEKRALQDERSHVAELELKKQQLLESLETKKKLVIPPPEELTKVIEEKKNAIAALQAEKRDIDFQSVEYQAQLETIRMIRGQHQTIKESLIDPLSGQLETLKEKCARVTQLDSENTALSAKVATLSKQVEHMEKKIEKKRAELINMQATEERELAPLYHLIAEAEGEAIKTDDKIKQLRKKIQESKEKFEKKQEKRQQLRDEFQKRCEKFRDVIKQKLSNIEMVLNE